MKIAVHFYLVFCFVQGALAQAPKMEMNIKQPGWVSLKEDYTKDVENKCKFTKPPSDTGPFCKGKDRDSGESFNGYIFAGSSVGDPTKYVNFCGGKWLGGECAFFLQWQELGNAWRCKLHSGSVNGWTCTSPDSPTSLTCTLIQGRFDCSNARFSFLKNSKIGNGIMQVELPGKGKGGRISDLDFRIGSGSGPKHDFGYPPTSDEPAHH